VTEKKLILLTNDDGIRSPGLWAAAALLETLGFVAVAAPREQCTSVGRSMPTTSSGRIFEEMVTVNGRDWRVHAVDGTPAQVVQHALLELLPRQPDLVVSGINYGENVGMGVTISGTVGAALEAASFGLPALAVSLETDPQYYYSHSDEVDFRVAAHFTRYFAERLLSVQRPQDVDVLKVEVPAEATPDTPWRMTRLSRTRYYLPVKSNRTDLSEPGPILAERAVEHDKLEPDSDVHAIVHKHVAVTPLSLDLTSRVDLNALGRVFRANDAP
jgi:5'-nucleotidase